MLNSQTKGFINLLLLLLITALHNLINAQQNFYNFEHFTVKNGLAHNNVYSIFQDHQGYLWFGTEDGLNKFDGYVFSTYRSLPKTDNSLATSNFGKIFQDSSGIFWFGTFGEGIDLYNPQTHKFIHMPHRPEDSTSLSNNRVTFIYQDNYQDIWVGTTDGGVNRYNKKTKTFIRYQPNKSQHSLSNAWAKCICETPDNKLWIGTRNGLNQFNRQSNSFAHFLLDTTDNPAEYQSNIQHMITDNQGFIWMGTAKQGLIRFDPKNGISKRYHNNAPNARIQNDNSFMYLFIDSFQNFWLGTNDGGLYQFNRETEKFTFIEDQRYTRQGIYCNRIEYITEDVSHNLWVATRGNGVWKLDLKPPKFNHLTHEPDNINSIPDANVTAVDVDLAGNLWIGTDGGGLTYYNKKLQKYTHFQADEKSRHSISGKRVWSIFVDHEGVIWVGTFNSGLNRLEKNKNGWLINKYKYSASNPHTLSSNQINAIIQDKQGNIWFATANGLNKLIKTRNPDDYYFENYLQNNVDTNGYADNYLVHMLIDSKNRIWIGSVTNGLLQFIPHSHNFKKYNSTIAQNPDSVDNYQVFHIYEDHKNGLWIGTELYGILKFDPDSLTYTHPKNYKPLIGNPVVGIIEDANQCLWISTSNGLLKYNPETGTLNRFDYNDGLLGTGFNRNAICADNQGLLYFGNNSALTCLNPQKLEFNQHKPNTVITGVSVLNKPINQSYLWPFENFISGNKVLSLNWKDYFFTIEFAALDFTSPQQNRYKYKLENFDNEWINSEKNRTATYTNLDPGTYIFKVKGSNNDHVWNNNPTTLTIKVVPPFWKKSWFRLFELGLVLLLVYLYVRIRTIMLVKDNKLLENKVQERTEKINLQKEELKVQAEHLAQVNDNLEKQVRERTYDLEKAKNKAEESDRLKSSFLANMSHEIRTPMNAIIGFSKLIQLSDINDVSLKNYVEHIIENSQSLLSLINNIIDISKIDTDQIKLNIKWVNVHDLLIDIYQRYKNFNTNPAIDFKFIAPGKSISLQINTDEHRLHQILDNLLNNAFKFTETGTIEIGYKPDDKNCRFFVRDTGIGLRKSQIDVIFSRFTKIEDPKNKIYRGAGLGLYISKKLVELLDGQMFVESTENKGSLFYFTLPYKYNS